MRRAVVCPQRRLCNGQADGNEARGGTSTEDHTIRIGAYRITADSRVWVNSDPSLLEDRWVVVE